MLQSMQHWRLIQDGVLRQSSHSNAEHPLPSSIPPTSPTVLELRDTQDKQDKLMILNKWESVNNSFHKLIKFNFVFMLYAQ